jgi:hypothetical protein
MSAIIVQKGDLSPSAFSNNNTNNAGGISVRVDTGSVVKTAIDSAVSAAATPDATDTVKGKVALAVAANHPSTSDDEAVTPAYLNAKIAALPTDKYVSGIQSYNAATNTITFQLADGSTSTANASALVADAVAEALAGINVSLLANDGTTVLGYIKP